MEQPEINLAAEAAQMAQDLELALHLVGKLSNNAASLHMSELAYALDNAYDAIVVAQRKIVVKEQ